MDYYQVLGVEKKADESQIKRAYKKLVSKFHPDKNQGDEEAIGKFKEITEAYEVLGDKQKRAEYDQFGHIRKKGAYTSHAHDFFNSFFGGSEQQQPQKLGRDIFVDYTVDLKFVSMGGDVEIKYQKHKKCEKCNGVGGEETVCNRCNGSGVAIIRNQFMSMQTTCNNCRGLGKLRTTNCDACNNGLCNPEEEVVNVFIPAGIQHGMRIQMDGKGEPGVDGCGRLIITVCTLKHELFERCNAVNLFSKVPITFSQLIAGCKLDVATLNGNVIVNIPPQTKSGTKFRLRNQGLPRIQNDRTIYDVGEMIVEVVLETPSSEEYSEILSQLRELEAKYTSKNQNKYKEYLENNNGMVETE